MSCSTEMIGVVFNSLVALGAWILWKMRNDIVFNGASPRIDQALLLAREEADLWMLAGAKGLSGQVAARVDWIVLVASY